MYELVVLFDGFSNVFEGDDVKANCSCTLLKGKHTIIVDTMTAWDRDKILDALKRNGVTPDEIDYCISTHGHSDHIGNLNLFLKAIHIVGFTINKGENFTFHPFSGGVNYDIDDCVSVVPTPGHTLSDVTVVVRNVNNLGVVAIAGDLFEKEEDLQDDSIWKSAGSENEELQKKNRDIILKTADWIVPGHGKMFKVPNKYTKN